MMKKVPSLLMTAQLPVAAQLPVPAKLPFPRWSKDPWPMPSGMHESLASQQVLTVEHAARQEWEDEGGTVRPPIDPGPKLPL
jgi:hypothetical protein